MIIGSIIGGYEAALGITTAVTAIGTLIQNGRSHNGNVIEPSHSQQVPIVDIHQGSAFDDVLNQDEQERIIHQRTEADLPDIPQMIQDNPELANNQNYPGLTYDDEDDISQQIAQHVDDYTQSQRETIVINEEDMINNEPEGEDPINVEDGEYNDLVQRIIDQFGQPEREPDGIQYQQGNKDKDPNNPGNTPIEPDYNPDIKQDEIEYDPHKGGIVDTSKELNNQEETPDQIINKQPNTRKQKMAKVFKLDRHNILAQTLTLNEPTSTVKIVQPAKPEEPKQVSVKPAKQEELKQSYSKTAKIIPQPSKTSIQTPGKGQLVSKFGFNTRSLQ